MEGNMFFKEEYQVGIMCGDDRFVVNIGKDSSSVIKKNNDGSEEDLSDQPLAIILISYVKTCSFIEVELNNLKYDTGTQLFNFTDNNNSVIDLKTGEKMSYKEGLKLEALKKLEYASEIIREANSMLKNSWK